MRAERPSVLLALAALAALAAGGAAQAASSLGGHPRGGGRIATDETFAARADAIALGRSKVDIWATSPRVVPCGGPA